MVFIPEEKIKINANKLLTEIEKKINYNMILYKKELVDQILICIKNLKKVADQPRIEISGKIDTIQELISDKKKDQLFLLVPNKDDVQYANNYWSSVLSSELFSKVRIICFFDLFDLTNENLNHKKNNYLIVSGWLNKKKMQKLYLNSI